MIIYITLLVLYCYFVLDLLLLFTLLLTVTLLLLLLFILVHGAIVVVPFVLHTHFVHCRVEHCCYHVVIFITPVFVVVVTLRCCLRCLHVIQLRFCCYCYVIVVVVVSWYINFVVITLLVLFVVVVVVRCYC